MGDILTLSEVAELLSSTKQQSRKKPLKRWMLTAEGEKVAYDTNAVGGFIGKTGTTRRSRKGRTYKLPNGSRRYIPGDGAIRENVIAYKP